MRILFAGAIIGSMRAQSDIKTICEKTACEKSTTESIEFYFWVPGFFCINKRCNTLIARGFKYIYNHIVLFFEYFYLFIMYLHTDIVFVLPINHSVAAFLLRLKQIINRKIIVDLYISAYTTYLDRKNRKQSRIKKYIKQDKIILEKSDIVISTCKFEIVDLCSKIGVDFSRVNLRSIPLIAVDRGCCNQKMSHDIFKIAWWGIWLPLHGLNNIIHACKILKDAGCFFELNLYGNENTDRFQYINLINELELSDVIHVYTNITFTNGKLESILKDDCDLALGHFGTSIKAKAACSNKIFDALAMGLTVLTQYNNTMKELFDNVDFINYSDTNPEDIANAIIRIINEKKYLDINTEAKKYMLEHFSEKCFNARMLSAFDEVCNTIK
jgi:glycosyltransferase involved in cell wall biosynthesis